MSRTWSALKGHPSGVLLVGQLLVVLAYPFLDSSTPGRAVLGVVQMVLVFTAVVAVRRTPALSWVALVFGVPGDGLRGPRGRRARHRLDRAGLGGACTCPFYFFVSYAMIRYLFHDDRVTRDELFATGAAFTVVAWAFAYVYAAARCSGPARSSARRRRRAAVVRPAVPLVHDADQRRAVRRRSRSAPTPLAGDVEQVAGVLYVALVVARLVGLTAGPRLDPALNVSLLLPALRAVALRHLADHQAVGLVDGLEQLVVGDARSRGCSSPSGRCSASRWPRPGGAPATRRRPRGWDRP